MIISDFQKSGIPPELTVAMLLERRGNEPFLVEVQVDTAVGRGEDSSYKRNKISPIHFDPKGESIGRDTLPLETDINDLRKVYLADLRQIGPINFIETSESKGIAGAVSAFYDLEVCCFPFGRSCSGHFLAPELSRWPVK